MGNILEFDLNDSDPNQTCGLLVVVGQKNPLRSIITRPRHHQPVITNREAMNPFMHDSEAAVEAGSSFCPRAN